MQVYNANVAIARWTFRFFASFVAIAVLAQVLRAIHVR